MLDFLVENLPDGRLLLFATLPFVLFAWGALSLAGWLKCKRNGPTGYTRKVFHFSIFISAAILQAGWGTRVLCLFAVCTSVVVFYALLRGDGHPLYEAIAREKDAPHRTRYIISPYIATALGGLCANVWFGPAALAGYLVTGVGDAIAEPVGTRFGRHPYRVLTLSGLRAHRTLEGSAAVGVASFIVLLLLSCFGAEAMGTRLSILTCLGIALASTLIEAISPHGWDNFSMQVLPAALVALAAGGMS